MEPVVNDKINIKRNPHPGPHTMTDRAGVIEGLESTADELRRITAHRDHLLVEARAAGVSLRVIGAATGLNHQTVANIANREFTDKQKGK